MTVVPAHAEAYEDWLRLRPGAGLKEAGLYFDADNAVHKALRKITEKLERLGVPYALAGAMAMYFHGYPRFTVDVDLVVGAQDLARIHEALDGLGYLPVVRGGKALRDTELGVKIDFLRSGEYPGDGKPKPVAFPHPQECSVVLDGFACLALPKLIELKLASGISSRDRLKDLADVQEMIKHLDLPRDLSGRLDPFVRGKYLELWDGVDRNPPEY
jgi:hypothetical protein